jgi:hypothetical protein
VIVVAGVDRTTPPRDATVRRSETSPMVLELAFGQASGSAGRVVIGFVLARAPIALALGREPKQAHGGRCCRHRRVPW